MTNREFFLDELRAAPSERVNDMFISFHNYRTENMPIETACARCLRLHGDQCPDMKEEGANGAFCRAATDAWAEAEAVRL